MGFQLVTLLLVATDDGESLDDGIGANCRFFLSLSSKLIQISSLRSSQYFQYNDATKCLLGEEGGAAAGGRGFVTVLFLSF